MESRSKTWRKSRSQIQITDFVAIPHIPLGIRLREDALRRGRHANDNADLASAVHSVEAKAFAEVVMTRSPSSPGSRERPGFRGHIGSMEYANRMGPSHARSPILSQKRAVQRVLGNGTSRIGS